MAENTYRIIIEAGGEGGAEAPGKAPVAEVPKTKQSSESSTGIFTLSSVKKNIGKMVAAGALVKAVQIHQEISMQKINIVTGQIQLAKRRQVHNSFINTGMAAVGAFLIAGPLGAGAVVAGSLANYGSSVVQKSTELYFKQYVEDEQLQALRTRAGASFNRSRLG